MFCTHKDMMIRYALVCCCLFGLFLPSMAAGDDQLSLRLEAWSAGYPPVLFDEKIVNPKLLQAFYGEHQIKPIWFEKGRLSKKGRELIQTISAVEGEGLQPSDYHYSLLSGLTREAVLPEYSLYDLVLSDALLTLVRHLSLGKVDPETLTDEWKNEQRPTDLAYVLPQVAGQGNLTELLANARPAQIRYSRLQNTLAQLRQLSADGWEPLSLSPAIKPGMSDRRLMEISRRLQIWQDLAGAVPALEYDFELQEAVKRFQSRHGLEADGIIGKETLLALNVSPAERVQQIIVNLERWRWLADDFGQRFLIVNIAAFELKLIEHNETLLRLPVVVGRSYRKTPVFSDKIRFLVLNPTWTVPKKLAVEDKLPEILRDKGFLNRLGFSVFPSDSTSAINPATVNWAHLSKSNFPYRLVQTPGPLNALGQIKFMFPNKYDVYLHDTSSRELFSKSERAFSSGCIRVSEPLVLAETLLREQKWDMDRLLTTIATGKTETVHLLNPVPIHIEYWTAWVERDGSLHFRKDIYERDKPLWKALQFSLTDPGQRPLLR